MIQIPITGTPEGFATLEEVVKGLYQGGKTHNSIKKEWYNVHDFVNTIDIDDAMSKKNTPSVKTNV